MCIGYGDGRCYVSTAAGVGVTVGVPVGVSVLASLVFFSLTVRYIKATPKVENTFNIKDPGRVELSRA